MIERIWDSFRRAYCMRRIYPYGTVGLSVLDDRTRLEKVCDRVDLWLFERRQAKRYEKAHQTKARWHRFYSLCLGGMVESSDQIRAYERKGYAWATPREFDEVANKAQKRIKEASDKRIQDKIERAAAEIKKGRSYVREQREAIKQGRPNVRLFGD